MAETKTGAILFANGGINMGIGLIMPGPGRCCLPVIY